jgi:hypothetical protein
MFALVGFQSACDFVYGVSRSAPIQVDPTPECVERVLRSTPGIDSVEHQQSARGRPLTMTGFQSPTLVENFFYQGPGNVRAVLQYTKDYAGRLKFSQSTLGFNRVPPQEDITATRPVMRKVELALESECGLSGLAAHVTEWCRKEVCGPLQ